MTTWTQEEYELHKAEVARRSQPNAWQKFTNKIKAFAAAPQAVSPYANNYKGIDVSVWQPAANLNYKTLKSSGVDFVIAKGFEVEYNRDPGTWYDGQFALHVQATYDAGIPYAVYFYADPQYYIDGQLTGGLGGYQNLAPKDNVEYMKLKEIMIGKVAPLFYCIDLERWYSSTNQYLEYLHGTRKLEDVGVIPSNWILANIDKNIEHIRYGIAHKEIPDAPIMIYTGAWFVNAYCKIAGSNAFYDRAPGWAKAGIMLWYAGYPWSGITCSWADLWAKYCPDGVNQKADPLNFDKATIWQTGVYMLPSGMGKNIQLDVDWMLITKSQADTLFKMGTVPPPVVHTCPTGQHWDDASQACVADVVIPPSPDLAALTARVVALEAKMAAIKAAL